MTTHISFDIETWGTEPGCDIRSVGACVFAPETGLVHDGSLGTIKPFYIATDNPTGAWGRDRWRTKFTPMNHWKRKYRLTRDPWTGAWGRDRWRTKFTPMNHWKRKYPLTRDPWAEQSDEAQTAFADPVELKMALERFADWLATVTGPAFESPSVRLWSHGSAFDPPILAAAYRACNLPVPWHYRAPRDTRTCFDMAGIDDHSAWLAQFSGDDRVQHHALSDAICQARAVCGAYARVQSPDREFHVGRIAMQQYANWTNQAIDVGGAWRNIEVAIHEGAK